MTMHPETRNSIETYEVTLYPTTLELLVDWLDGRPVSEIDWFRASWAKLLYEQRRRMDAQWEPFRVGVNLSTVGILLDEIDARLEAVDSMLSGMDEHDPDHQRLFRERQRLLQDQTALSDLLTGR